MDLLVSPNCRCPRASVCCVLEILIAAFYGFCLHGLGCKVQALLMVIKNRLYCSVREISYRNASLKCGW